MRPQNQEKNQNLNLNFINPLQIVPLFIGHLIKVNRQKSDIAWDLIYSWA